MTARPRPHRRRDRRAVAPYDSLESRLDRIIERSTEMIAEKARELIKRRDGEDLKAKRAS